MSGLAAQLKVAFPEAPSHTQGLIERAAAAVARSAESRSSTFGEERRMRVESLWRVRGDAFASTGSCIGGVEALLVASVFGDAVDLAADALKRALAGACSVEVRSLTLEEEEVLVGGR